MNREPMSMNNRRPVGSRECEQRRTLSPTRVSGEPLARGSLRVPDPTERSLRSDLTSEIARQKPDK